MLIDGTDNFETRYFISALCEDLGKPWIFASIQGWQGQLSFCNVFLQDGTRSASYHHLFPEAPAPGEAPTCEEIGVAGTLPAVMGSLQANEALKFFTGAGELLSNKLLTVDLLHNSFTTLTYGKPRVKHEEEKTPALTAFSTEKTELSHEEALQIPDLRRIDIREDWEYDVQNTGDENIPYHRLLPQLAELASHYSILLICEKGNRSREITRHARHKLGLQNVYSLEGGIQKMMQK